MKPISLKLLVELQECLRLAFVAGEDPTVFSTSELVRIITAYANLRAYLDEVPDNPVTVVTE
ncbi:MAG: hypothetical protein ACOH2B_05465 [Burkholderiaceae bacterium]